MGSLNKSLVLSGLRCSGPAQRTPSRVRQNRSAVQTGVMLATAVVLVISVPETGFAKTTFTLSDLAGEWNLHGLTSGYPGDFQSWVYGTMTCDGNGVFTGQGTNKTGETNQRTGMFEISPLGVITMRGVAGPASSFHGVMNNNKDTIVFTMNDGGGGYDLAIYTKSGGTFTMSDLQGTWVYHGLISGNVPDPVPLWWHGSMKIDEDGNAVFNSVDSEGSMAKETLSPLKLPITESGIITGLDPENGPSHGTMNQSKDMIVLVGTVFVGHIPGDTLFVAEKQMAGSYATRDLAGTWYVHGLTSSSSYDDWIGWGHFTLLVDNQGKGSIVTGSYLNSLGETDHAWSGTMSITSDGIVTGIGALCHGMMNLGKDMWVCTMDDGGGGSGMVIAVGRSPLDEFDFNADGRVDFLDLANFANHWLN
jgi:hypothetical protein